ncbi:MAG: hypothetical protein R3B90_19415 [Planctomycetaceae bacterium]
MSVAAESESNASVARRPGGRWAGVAATLAAAIMLGIAIAHLPGLYRRPLLTPLAMGGVLAWGAIRLGGTATVTIRKAAIVLAIATMLSIAAMHAESFRMLDRRAADAASLNPSLRLQYDMLNQLVTRGEPLQPKDERWLLELRLQLEPNLPDYLRWRLSGLGELGTNAALLASLLEALAAAGLGAWLTARMILPALPE